MSKTNLNSLLVSVAALMVIAVSGVYLVKSFSDKKDAAQSGEVISNKANELPPAAQPKEAVAAPASAKVVKKDDVKTVVTKKTANLKTDYSDVKIKRTGNPEVDLERRRELLYKDL